MKVLASVLALLLLAQSGGASTVYEVIAYYYSSCVGTPFYVYVDIPSDGNCTANTSCPYSWSVGDSTMRTATYCVSDYQSKIWSLFGDVECLLAERYNDDTCSTLSSAEVYVPTGNCETLYSQSYVVAKVNKTTGSASIQYSTDPSCEYLYANISADKETLNSHTCDNSVKWYTNAEVSSSTSSGSSSTNSNTDGSASSRSSNGLSTGAIIAISAGAFGIVLLAVGFLVRRRYTSSKGSQDGTGSQSRTNNLTSGMGGDGALRGQEGLWNDDVITAARIPRDKVRATKLLTRGAFGDVYLGFFYDQQVAIKSLPPDTRKDLRHVNAFLAEAKMAASMDHPHIVRFIGVAWDSLTDLCVVLEFMEGGDLRSLLDDYQATNHPVGFDRQKTLMALDVCHAITYLHSLQPPVIHRDLKSRNILLSRELEAKLTDFGISREKLDATLTAGVGTSLWMAPEVMVGERYDTQADVFSFGVVLSELDLHSKPYAHARDTTGRVISDAVLLQKVAMGTSQVEFSEASPASIVELGRACVSVDPKQRPTAAETLYKLQLILNKELA